MGLAPFVGLGLYTLLSRKGRLLLIYPKFYYMLIIIIVITSAYYIAREFVDPGYIQGVIEYEILSFKK